MPITPDSSTGSVSTIRGTDVPGTGAIVSEEDAIRAFNGPSNVALVAYYGQMAHSIGACNDGFVRSENITEIFPNHDLSEANKRFFQCYKLGGETQPVSKYLTTQATKLRSHQKSDPAVTYIPVTPATIHEARKAQLLQKQKRLSEIRNSTSWPAHPSSTSYNGKSETLKDVFDQPSASYAWIARVRQPDGKGGETEEWLRRHYNTDNNSAAEVDFEKATALPLIDDSQTDAIRDLMTDRKENIKSKGIWDKKRHWEDIYPQLMDTKMEGDAKILDQEYERIMEEREFAPLMPLSTAIELFEGEAPATFVSRYLLLSLNQKGEPLQGPHTDISRNHQTPSAHSQEGLANYLNGANQVPTYQFLDVKRADFRELKRRDPDTNYHLIAPVTHASLVAHMRRQGRSIQTSFHDHGHSTMLDAPNTVTNASNCVPNPISAKTHVDAGQSDVLDQFYGAPQSLVSYNYTDHVDGKQIVGDWYNRHLSNRPNQEAADAFKLATRLTPLPDVVQTLKDMTTLSKVFGAASIGKQDWKAVPYSIINQILSDPACQQQCYGAPKEREEKEYP